MKVKDIGPVFVILATLSCGKKATDTASDGAENIDTVDPETINPMALLVPEGITIPSFPLAANASLNLDEEIVDRDLKKSFKERLEEQRQILIGEADCLDLNIFRHIRKDNISVLPQKVWIA